MCGEKFALDGPQPHAGGSPPHVRGKEWVKDFYKLEKGITPACAGKSEPPLANAS